MGNFYIQKYNLKPADRIVTPKSSLRWVQHHVVYLGQNHNGVDLIAENKQGHGVRVITANQFFNEINEVTRIERFRGSSYERRVAVERALREVGQPYSLINFNCESYANLVQHNKAKSRQAGTGLFLGFLGLLLLLGSAASGSNNKKR